MMQDRRFLGPSWTDNGLDGMCRVYNILDGTATNEKILYRDDDPEQGFVLAAD